MAKTERQHLQTTIYKTYTYN